MTGLDDKVAIVTDGGVGLGPRHRGAESRKGARVVVVDVDEAHGDAVVEELRAAGSDGRLVVGDVSHLDVAREAVAVATDDLGRLDVLVNNAGIVQGDDRDTWDTTEDGDRVLQVNLRSVFACSKAAIPAMLAGGGGSIVNMASIAASVCTGGPRTRRQRARSSATPATRRGSWHAGECGSSAGCRPGSCARR